MLFSRELYCQFGVEELLVSKLWPLELICPPTSLGWEEKVAWRGDVTQTRSLSNPRLLQLPLQLWRQPLQVQLTREPGI